MSISFHGFSNVKLNALSMVRFENDLSKLLASLYGEIDHHTARGLREEIDNEIKRKLPKLLILDFGNVTFMDSSGIGLVMGRYKLVSAMNGEIKVINTSASIRRVMMLAGINRLAEIEE